MTSLASRTERFDSRADWLAARTQSIGGSDIAVLLGISTWRTPIAVWATKVGAIPLDDEEEARHQRIGHAMEPIIADEFTHDTGIELVDFGDHAITRHPEHRFVTATLDRVTADDDAVPVELKNANASVARQWDEQPPLIYQVQVQWQLLATGAPYGYLAAIIGGSGFKWARIERHDAFIEYALRVASDFWKCVESETPPEIDVNDASDETRKVLQAMYPEDRELPPIVLDDAHADLARRYLAACDEARDADTAKKAVVNWLRKAAGKATEAIVPGVGIWKRQRNDVWRFKAQETETDE